MTIRDKACLVKKGKIRRTYYAMGKNCPIWDNMEKHYLLPNLACLSTVPHKIS